MPTTYAHYYFGDLVYRNMPQDIQKIVKEHRALYDTGVHGPDLFFYYNALVKNPVARYGSELHLKSGRNFFESCRLPYIGLDDKEAMLAYLLGFLSHFVLDSHCHGYIEAKKEASGLSHNKVESEYDRHLIEINGKSPKKENRTRNLKCHAKEAEVIARFYPFETKVLLKAVNDQRLFLGLLHISSNLKYQFLSKAMEMLKVNPEFRDLMISPVSEPLCKDSNLRLDKLMAKAVKSYPMHMASLLAYLEEGEKLPAFFDADFEAGPDYKSIPVLSLEDEIHFLL